MKYIFFLIVIYLGTSCRTTKVHYGTYASTCFIQTETDLLLILNYDKTFQYKFAHSSNTIAGTWSAHRDTLIMMSNQFKKSDDVMLPKVKKSDFDEKDIYIIKGKTLYTINKNGISKDCVMKYISNSK